MGYRQGISSHCVIGSNGWAFMQWRSCWAAINSAPATEGNRFCVALATPFLIELEDFLGQTDKHNTAATDVVDLWFRMGLCVFIKDMRGRNTNRG